MLRKLIGISTLRRIDKRHLKMDLKHVIKLVEEYGNPKIACNWDNVGLLVEPSGELKVNKILLTNDLTEPVLDEAIKEHANMIITYHPAIFSPLKRLTQSEWKQRSIVKCIENRIAVYSPHTTWDAIEGGINDWILSAFETKKIEPVESIKSLKYPCDFAKTVQVIVSNKQEFMNKILELEDNSIKFLSEKHLSNSDLIEIEFLSTPKGVAQLISQINEPKILSSLRVLDLEKPLMMNAGLGRIGYLKEGIALNEVVSRLKKHFSLKNLRIALANGKSLDDKIKSLAVCAGSGSKLLSNLNVDLVVTGEFSHHEILHEVHRGTSVILTDHTNNERGYLPVFRQRFFDLLKANNQTVEIIVSSVDRDPLEYI